MLNFEAEKRPLVLGRYMVEHGATVRETAARFGVSKSTVHKDVTHNLKNINKALYLEVQKLLDKNKQERHLRGGEATRLKYSELHQDKNFV